MVVVSIQVERVSDIDPKVTREKFYCILHSESSCSLEL